MTDKTPAGIPARCANTINASALNGVAEAGLITIVQPAAKAAAALRVIIAAGKFHGVMAAHTPSASTAADVYSMIISVVGRPNPQRGVVESSDPMFEDNVHLHWLDRAPGANPPDNENALNEDQIRSVDVHAVKDALAHIGRLRFDTVFIRNLIFIVNLYRSIRMKLQRDLSYSKDIIARAEPITRANLTEFFGNQTSHSSHARALAGFGRKY